MPSSFGCGRAFSPLQHREQGSKVAKRTPIGVKFQKLHAGAVRMPKPINRLCNCDYVAYC